MASGSFPPRPNTSPQHHRARRIPDTEWEAWREQLVRLYVEDDLSRNSIVDIMAREHDFIITDKQLKHRFHKWDVRKNINDRDMAIMISVNKSNQALGRSVRFQYKGHEVDRERIERAQKRRKGPLPNPTIVPPHIKAHPSPFPISQTNQSVPAPRNTSFGRVSGSSDLGLTTLNTFAQTQSLDYALNPEQSVESQTICELPDTLQYPYVKKSSIMSAGSSMIPSQSSEIGSYETIVMGTTFAHACSALETAPYEYTFLDDRSIPQTFEDPAPSPEDVDLAAFINLSPRRNSSTEQSRSRLSGCGSISIGFKPLLLSQTSCYTSGDRKIFASEEPTGISTRYVSETYLPTPINALAYRNGIHELASQNLDPESVAFSLQLLKSHLVESIDDIVPIGQTTFLEYPSTKECTSSGPTLPSLCELVHSRWLWIEFEDLLCWSHEASLRAIRQRQEARKRRRPDDHPSPIMGHVRGNQDTLINVKTLGGQRTDQPGLRAKITSYFTSVLPTGGLKIKYGAMLRDSMDVTESDRPRLLIISFMRSSTKRTTGITVTITKQSDAILEPRISPHISTFNVVPKNSDIVQYVSKNDLGAVQRLFQNREASPLDVDPQGFSLLSYAMYAGCSDVFRLLLKGGAGMQNCSHFGITQDLVWAIWGNFKTFNSGPQNVDFSVNMVRDFDQCVGMTNLALEHGCDIEDSVEHHRKANLLFEWADTCALNDAHPSTSENAIEYLIKVAGYDVEKRNSNSQTPLLYTAAAFQPQVIKCIKALVQGGANVHAVDRKGWGALHYTLTAPKAYDNWRTLRLVHSLIDCPMNYYFVPYRAYSTETAMHREDYTDESFNLKPTAQRKGDLAGSRYAERCARSCKTMKLPQRGSSDPMKEIHKPQRIALKTVCCCDKHCCEYVIENDDDAQGEAMDNITPRDASLVDDLTYEHVLCKDFRGVEHWIQNPIQVLKTRVRFKLLTLLSLGCDPNVLDHEGQSPSDIARRDGLWIQWSWALMKTGYIHDTESDLWIKSSLSGLGGGEEPFDWLSF